ncbi:UNVERIFIED_CONTAM: hypothetical protein Sradi_1772100 [Sesamum radiatum]|uniref:Retrotransposon gag protein n=1 Tax=Sesamum radiatum TaxID=300843 RepID=A0AAW2TUZ9_SESRA
MEIMGVVERPMMEDSSPTADGTISSITKPVVEASNFEIKPTTIQIIRSSVQFSGLPDEDPNKHLINFLEICDTFKFNGVSNDAVRLRIFPFSLCDTAKDWLQSLLAAAGGTIMKKLPSEAFNIIDEIATNLYTYGSTFNPYSSTYNSGWRSHPNFLWSNNQQQGPQGYHQPQQQDPQEKNTNLEDMLSKFITAVDTRFQNQDASIRNLEMQVGKLVGIVSERKEGQLPSDTEKNSREQVNTISVRNDRAIEDEPPKDQVEEAQAKQEEKSQEETKGSPLKLNLDAIPPYIPYPKRILKANLDK